MKNTIYFILGFVMFAVVTPLLAQAGVPRYSDFLYAVFGDNKNWGVGFTVILIGVIIAFVYFKTNKNNQLKEV